MYIYVFISICKRILYLWATVSSADLRSGLYLLLCLCVWGRAIVGLWGCEFVGLWVRGLVFCEFVDLWVCVCVFACLCLFAGRVFLCDCV